MDRTKNIKRIQSKMDGSKKEQERIYDLFCKQLYFTSYRIVGNSFDAEEIMHDTLLKYFKLQILFDSDKECERWLKRVCINLSIDRYRKKNRELFTLLPEEKMASLNETDEHLQDIGDNNGITPAIIKKAIESLADGYRIILTLFLFEGYDYQEISKILNINEVTVRSQYMRGKKRLRELLSNVKN
jgi:RNA polymerase sigma-70 factor (ECF subfamily)